MLPVAKVAFARLYWAVFARLIGIKVRVIGNSRRDRVGRRLVYVSNHSSWVDIPVVGSVLEGCFVSKGDVAPWPVIRTIARLGDSLRIQEQGFHRRNATSCAPG